MSDNHMVPSITPLLVKFRMRVGLGLHSRSARGSY